jgi:hypothetical protein
MQIVSGILPETIYISISVTAIYISRDKRYLFYSSFISIFS